ncbi:MAG TPA: M23 family metallopeptidase [Acidobacteriota bacterium]|nr:M23 family metallopeptidase [Acidobacteriota bacterium]
MKRVLIVVAVALVAVMAYFWDGQAPQVEWIEAPEVVGASKPVAFAVSDAGKGLARIEVTVEQAGQSEVVLREDIGRNWAPWSQADLQRQVAVTPVADLKNLQLQEGEFTLRVTAYDHANLYFFDRQSSAEKTLRFDRTPPVISILSTQHRVDQGGAEAVLYRLDEEAAASGVEVGERSHPGHPLQGRQGHYGAIFALPYNAPLNTRFRVWAEDAAGNRSTAQLQVEARVRRFRQRRINISDSFIEKVAPEILSRSGLQPAETPAQTFLLINNKMRTDNHRQIRGIIARSAGRLLFDEAFLQLTNSKVEAPFADQRTYIYQGQAIDRQTHLGFDLASTAKSPVEAANDGVVLHAGYLGIYGNCVLIDHGFGVVSLYGHLSSIDVSEGQQVEKGELIGRTGETGLAGGDHLHFAIFVQETAVNPLEWWDSSWLGNHIFKRLRGGQGQS